jgi:hypothetical protein
MTGLAPEIPEDLYMLIKKVCMDIVWLVGHGELISARLSLFASISNATEKTKTPSSASF